MAILIYKYSGSGTFYGDPVKVDEAWGPDVVKMWQAVLVPPAYTLVQPPWVPTYESVTISWFDNNGTLQKIVENPAYEFPTKETADGLALRFAIDGKPLGVIEVPWIQAGPTMVTDANQRLLLFPNGKTLPAYQLANYFTFNPEDKSDAAETLSKLLIAKVWP